MATNKPTILFEENNCFLNSYEYTNKELLKLCVNEVKDNLEIKPEIIVYDKVCHQQRDIGFYSNESIGYFYSNKLMKSKPLTENLSLLLQEINEIFSTEFNGILINRYNDGNNYIGPHSDDERGLEDKAGVIALSYGAVRTFRIRDKKTKKNVIDVQTENCRILQMGGNFQKFYTHEIPIQKKVKEERYSFTFRKHIQ
jgi:alkylated DNA repair dioxygenase AlkB